MSEATVNFREGHATKYFQDILVLFNYTVCSENVWKRGKQMSASAESQQLISWRIAGTFTQNLPGSKYLSSCVSTWQNYPGTHSCTAYFIVGAEYRWFRVYKFVCMKRTQCLKIRISLLQFHFKIILGARTSRLKSWLIMWRNIGILHIEIPCSPAFGKEESVALSTSTFTHISRNSSKTVAKIK